MGRSKYYVIVTNDEYEFPIKYDIKGAKGVAEFIGISVSTVRKNLYYNKWGHNLKYKAFVDFSIKERPFKIKEYQSVYRKTHDRKEYMRKYYLMRKGRLQNE